MNSLHFAPRRNWMNDPNGLVFHDGRYHLFFQHNPLGAVHKNMSWGHASSPDLVSWREHPVAIRFDEDEDIFSGSIVVDTEGSTGFSSDGTPALVAFYTSESRRERHQAQAIAYSLDAGETWTKYTMNPVVDRNSADFRDPKVFRFTGATESYWVMVAVEAEDHQVVLYRSEDLLSWTFMSSFGPQGAVGGAWECPDLFPLCLDGTGEIAWVLLVSVFPGGIAGGSGTQYFVGEFDGREFRPREHLPEVSPSDKEAMAGLDWLDYGRDCYAGVSFSGLADEDRTLIAWMNNWDYAHGLPLRAGAPQRGSMTLARRLSLISVDGRPRLRQVPVVPASIETSSIEDLGLAAGASVDLAVPGAGRVLLSVALEDSAGFTLHITGAAGAGIVLAYDAIAQELSLDRRGAGEGYPQEFASVERMPVAAGAEISLMLWLDERAVEIYAEDGARVLTDLVGAVRPSGISVSPIGGSLRVVRLSVSEAVQSVTDEGLVGLSALEG